MDGIDQSRVAIHQKSLRWVSVCFRHVYLLPCTSFLWQRVFSDEGKSTTCCFFFFRGIHGLIKLQGLNKFYPPTFTWRNILSRFFLEALTVEVLLFGYKVFNVITLQINQERLFLCTCIFEKLKFLKTRLHLFHFVNRVFLFFFFQISTQLCYTCFLYPIAWNAFFLFNFNLWLTWLLFVWKFKKICLNIAWMLSMNKDHDIPSVWIRFRFAIRG